MLKEKRNWLFFIAYIAILIAAVALILRIDLPKKAPQHRVGFITTGSFSDPGWDSRHFEGLKEACLSTGVELLVRDGVGEFTGACPEAVRELVQEGAEMIILSAGGYSPEMSEYFDDYPQVAFYGIFSDLGYPNLTGYSTRMYQARYLSGIVAGMETKSGIIGFVATVPSIEVYRGVNAFALGVRRVRPDAEVRLVLTGSLGNDGTDTAAANRLIRSGADVLTHHQGQYSVVDAAEAAKVASIGYYESGGKHSDLFLTCAICDWEMLYTELLREYLGGKSSHMLNDWLGFDSGVIQLTALSPRVSEAAWEELRNAEEEMLTRRDVFTGEIWDNEGRLRCGPGEALSDDTLTQGIDWLVEGVVLYE